MSDFEDKLNKILSSPEDMERIMGMARSLSGSQGEPSGDGDSERGSGADLSSALGNLDPRMLRMVTRAFGEYSSNDKGKAALLGAIKPYLKEDKRHRMDRAAEIVKIAHLARIAFSEFSGGDDGV